MSLKKHQITARVTGHYDPFYRVVITLPQIPKDKIEKLIDSIVKSPLLVAKLSSHELDPSICELCEKLGVSLFPKRWSDFDMYCSCPDWAVPCKHIAAVIYKISQEIDADPFVLFTVRGIDLVKELESRGVAIKKTTKIQLPTWRELIGIPSKFARRLTKPNAPALTSRTDNVQEIADESFESSEIWLKQLAELTFTPIEFEKDSLTNLLKDNPAGYIHGSLKDSFKRVLETAAKLAQKQMNDVKPRSIPMLEGENEWLSVNTWGQTIVNEGLVWTENTSENGHGFKYRPGDTRTTDNSFVFLSQMFSGYLNSRHFSSAPVALEALYDAWLIASRFVQAQAVKPQLYEPEKDIFTTRWIPVASTSAMEEFLEKLGSALLRLRAPYLEILSRPQNLPPRTMADIVLGMFISSYVGAAYRKIATTAVTTQEQALFVGTPIDCERKTEMKTVRLGLVEWLTPLEKQSQDNLRPVLSVYDLLGSERAKSVEDAFTRPISVELGFHVSQGNHKKSSYVALGDIIALPELSKYRPDALRYAARLSDYCPELVEMLRLASSKVFVTMQDLSQLMFKAIPALRILGVEVILPRSLNRLLQPGLSMEIDMDKDWDENSGFLGLATLLDFDWRIAVGDIKITREEFAELAQKAGEIVYFHNRFVYVDEKQIAAIQKKLSAKATAVNRMGLIRAALGGKYNQATVLLSDKVKKALESLFKQKSYDIPKTVHAQLRPYQKRGFEWLIRNIRIGLGSILADDMGLGKTLQVLTTLEALRQGKELDKKPALVVVPTSLIENWIRESRKFTPELKIQPFYGAMRELNVEGVHVILTTYGLLRNSLSQFKKKHFRLLILDEAQAIKNHKTSTFKAVRAIQSDVRIAMSGTPVENRLLEYWSIMEATNPGLLGSSTKFKEEFSFPIEVGHDLQVANRFKKMTAPFIMRRLKSDKTIISDLPDKITTNEFCTLTPEQVMLYKEAVQAMMTKIAESNNQFTRQAIVLQLMTQLKQICNAPLQYQEKSEFNRAEHSGKMQRLFELLDMLQESNRKVLVFTQFKEMGLLLQEWIAERYGQKPEFIHGALSVKERQRIVDDFQTKRDKKVLVLSLKAAGTGLNLTAASAIVHYDLWWNPAVESQATDRAYRIGQKRNVNVYRLICSHSFEEKINDLMRTKLALTEMTVATGESWIGDLSNQELEDIFSLEQ